MLDSSNNFGGLNAAGQAAFSNPYSTQPNPVNPISSRYSPDTIIPPKPVAPTPIKAAPLPISSRYTPDTGTANSTPGIISRSIPTAPSMNFSVGAGLSPNQKNQSSQYTPIDLTSLPQSKINTAKIGRASCRERV